MYDRCGHYRIVTASITQDQANITFNQAVRLVRQSPIMESLVASLVRTPFPQLTFMNGACIEARSTQNRGEYLLGNDYDLFIFDEVAFETDPEYVVEEIIQMRLADREGRLDLVSTPNGKNWFYRRTREIVDGGRPGYVQSGDSRQNCYISRDFLDDRLKYFTDRRIQQNIMGEFVDAGGEILIGEYIDRALAGYRPHRDRLDEILSSESKGSICFISGWDLARKRTATVGITVAIIENIAIVVELTRLRLFEWRVVLEKIKQRQMMYPGRLVIDATGLGDVIAEQLREFNPTCFLFTPASKAELLTNVELVHARQDVFYDRWELPDGPGKTWSLEDELRSACWDDNNECDALMALGLALHPLRRRSDITPLPRVGRI